MESRFEYKFVRLGEGWLGASAKDVKNYQQIVEQNAQEGWRLIQVFAPGLGSMGTSKYFEVILERPVDATLN